MKILDDWETMIIGRSRRHLLSVDHGVVDDKNRTIGGIAIIDDRRQLNPPAGQQFELEIRTLRGGHQFGAMRPSSFYETLVKAKTEATKRLARQGKGFAKLYGGKS